jgi:hypothetical protein
LLGLRQRCLHMRQDVLGADMLDELGLLEELGGLVPRAAEDQRPSGPGQAIAEGLQNVQAGRIDGRHVPQAQNQDRRES